MGPRDGHLALYASALATWLALGGCFSLGYDPIAQDGGVDGGGDHADTSTGTRNTTGGAPGPAGMPPKRDAGADAAIDSARDDGADASEPDVDAATADAEAGVDSGNAPCEPGVSVCGECNAGDDCLRPVASWSFESNARDDTPNANHGATGNVSYEPGIEDNAIRVGPESQVWVPDSASLDFTSELTVEGWVMLDAVPDDGRVGILDNDGQWGLFVYAEGFPRCSAAGAALLSPVAISAGVWTHLACTYDGAFLRLYIDGFEADSRAQTGAISTGNAQDIAIGGNSPAGDRMTGLIDSLRVWSVALSDAELCGIAGTCVDQRE